MALRDFLAVSVVAIVWASTIGICALYLYYSGILARHMRVHHPEVWADRIAVAYRPYYFNHWSRPVRFLNFVIKGNDKARSDDELYRLLGISRLLALGCMVGITVSIVVTVALPDFHLPPPPGYSRYR